MIVFDYRPPSPALREYVRQYQIVGFSFAADAVVPVKPYWPRPQDCLTFYPRDTEVIEHVNGITDKWRTRSSIVGQHSFVMNRQPSHDFLFFQVAFQPGGLFRLTGIPAHELTNTFIDAEAVFSLEIRLVNERLSSTDNHLEMIGIVEDFLMFLIRRSSRELLPIDRVNHLMLQKPGLYTLDWLADQACLSSRQFYHNFLQRVGVGPKLYSRIIRFDNAVKLKNAQPARDWFSIGSALGYYDYQHLVKDFREFTGQTPPQFFQRESGAPERGFGHAET